MKLSIIIPMYNVEKYIERCLASCINQENASNDDYEIIVVNDGTKDNSLQIAERFVAGLSNVTIVSQENGGLSAARNKGLSLAKGDYVWFVDSDDWISKDAVSIILGTTRNNSPDVVKIGYANTQHDNEEAIIIHNNEIPKGIYTGIEILNKHNWPPPAPFFIFKTSFLREQKLEFHIGILHEDNEFTPRMLYYAKTVVVIDNVLYYYMLGNPTSITNVVKPKRVHDLITIILTLNNFSESIVKDNDSKISFNRFISLVINTAIYYALLVPKEDLDAIIAKFSKHKTTIRKNMLASGKIKYMMQGLLVSVFPMSVYFKIHRMLVH